MKDKISLAVFTEASGEIGTGHLTESLNLVKLARKNGLDVDFWVSRSTPRPILGKIRFSYSVFSDLKEAKNILKKKKFDVAVFNFRSMENSILSGLAGSFLKTLCIDELGGRRLDCDVVINAMIVDKYHRYPASGRKTRFFTGADYFSMAPEFIEARNGRSVFDRAIGEVTVSMGGLDRTGATLNIIDALTGWRKEVRKNIILGGAFPFFAKVREKSRMLKSLNFKIYQNVNNVAPIFMKSDVVFTAGGNTLYELACLGTPAIVLYEDEHEKESGLAFARRGFGVCLGKDCDTEKEVILSALERLDDYRIRNRQSLQGRKIVDGRGTARILNIVERLSRG